MSPHPWGRRHEVNEFAGRICAGLAERGHQVLLAAPSESRKAVRDSRRAIAAAKERSASPFSGWKGERVCPDGPPVLAIGSGLPMPHGPRPRAAPVPLDVSRTLDRLLGGVELDLVHVHDPFAPSASSAALRHSRSLNVGSFHEPSERVLSTQVARPLVEIFLGRLDARTVSSRTTGELLERFFPGADEELSPGAPADAAPWWPKGSPGEPLKIAFCLEEERGALRLLLRALRRLRDRPGWEAAVWVGEGPEVRIPTALRERVRLTGPREGDPEGLLAGADIACVASGGPRPAEAARRRPERTGPASRTSSASWRYGRRGGPGRSRPGVAPPVSRAPARSARGSCPR